MNTDQEGDGGANAIQHAAGDAFAAVGAHHHIENVKMMSPS